MIQPKKKNSNGSPAKEGMGIPTNTKRKGPKRGPSINSGSRLPGHQGSTTKIKSIKPIMDPSIFEEKPKKIKKKKETSIIGTKRTGYPQKKVLPTGSKFELGGFLEPTIENID